MSFRNTHSSRLTILLSPCSDASQNFSSTNTSKWLNYVACKSLSTYSLHHQNSSSHTMHMLETERACLRLQYLVFNSLSAGFFSKSSEELTPLGKTTNFCNSITCLSWLCNPSPVWEIPRSGYTHVTRRRRMCAVVFACSFEGLNHTFGSMRAWQPQSAGVARWIFFLLRHLSKFPSFKKENPSCPFWDMALGIFAAAFEKRSLPSYTRVRWRGMVRCGALAPKARKSMLVETSFAGAPVHECTNRVWRNSLRAPRCC